MLNKEIQKKPLSMGRVKEVTEKEDYILLPLSPLDHRQTHFFATIIYDLVKLGYKKEDLKFNYGDFLKKNSIKRIIDYVESNGRMIWESTQPMNSKEIIIEVKNG